MVFKRFFPSGRHLVPLAFTDCSRVPDRFPPVCNRSAEHSAACTDSDFFVCVGLLVAGYFVYGKVVDRTFGLDLGRLGPGPFQRPLTGRPFCSFRKKTDL